MKCSLCGKEFDPADAWGGIDEEFGDGMYEECYPEEDVCLECALANISADIATGNETLELIYGPDWATYED